MQSVRSRGSRSRKSAARGRAAQDDGVVARLLAFFRVEQSPAEIFETLRDHTVQGTMPMRTPIIACLVFYAVVICYGAILGGNYNSFGQAVAAARMSAAEISGFTLRNIEIEGAAPHHKVDILAAIETEPGDPIFGIDMVEARQRLERLPWVERATLLRLLPDTLKVTIEERKPFALWQHGGKLAVIDMDGNVISNELDEQNAALPLVVGFGANRTARGFLSEIDEFPAIRTRMRAAIRVADRRWNIRLLNGVDIRLPEEKPRAALEEIAALDEAYGLLARDVVALDFRLPDRITIRLTDEAATRRDMLIKEQRELDAKRKKRQDT